MGLPLLSAPNWLDATYYPVTFVGGYGSWRSALPLTNLRNRRFSALARSTNALATSTQFMLDLGTLRQIRFMAIPRSNIGRLGTVRFRFFQGAGATLPVGDTGTIDYWRTVYEYGSLPFEHPSWLDGKITDEERDEYPMPFIHVLSEDLLARYVWVEIVDTSNADGYTDIPRLIVGPAWFPSTGIITGASLGYQDPSQEAQSMGSIFFFDERPGFRTARFTIPNLSFSETFGTAWQLVRSLKKTKEVFFSLDPEDATNLHRWSFLATCKEVPQVEFAESLYQSITFELREVVG